MNKQLLLISISTFIAVISWIAFDIKHATPSVILNAKIPTLLEPINPVFDQTLLQQISQINDIPDLNAYGSIPEPSTSTPTSSPSAIPLPPGVVDLTSPIPEATSTATF